MTVQRRNGAVRRVSGTVLAIIVMMISSTGAWAVDLTKQVKFSIAAQKLSSALLEFSHQAKVQVIVGPEVGDRPTTGVSGTHSIAEALTTLLSGSSLAYRVVNETSIAVGSAATLQDQSSGTANATARTPIAAVGSQAAAAVESQSAESLVPSTGPPSSSSSSSRDAIPEILVKGSRIMNVDVTRTEDDAQPYYIFDSQQIEQSGLTNVEDFLKQRLTMNTTFLNSNQQQGGQPQTTSSINLRGLGANETLILIDGRRSASVNLGGGLGQPDINGIPLAAIERIEVLPSSASAIYGGAALGGVVNIILKRNFHGGELGVTDDNTFNANSPRRTVNGIYGFSLEEGKTRVMLSGSYSDGEPLTLHDRLGLEGRYISTVLNNLPSFYYNASNPFSGATPNIACQDANSNPTNCVLRNGTPLKSPITSIPAGATPGANLSTGLLANAGTYNLNLAPGTETLGLQNQIGLVPLMKSAMATVRREFTPSLEAFTEFSTVSNSSRQVFNPFGGNYPVPAGAPDNPFQQAVLINFPTAVTAPSTSDSVTQSATVGLIAHLPSNWRSELDYTWSQNLIEYYAAQVDSTALDSALAAGAVNPFADTIAYPLNLTPYIGSNSASSRSTLNDIALRASGPVGSLPWGAPILTIGLEHRKEGYSNARVSFLYPSTPANDYESDTFGSSQSTDSVYMEAALPLVTAKNAVPGIHSLDLQLAGRSEHYTVFASQDYATLLPTSQLFQFPHPTITYTSTNPTIGLKYRPVEELTLRASYATAFLPPTPTQLIPVSTPFCGYPCQSITDPKNGQTYNVDITYGGNPNLKPQTSRDLDLGVIWEPGEEILRGLRMDLEYYKIVQPNYITTPTVQQVVSDPSLASRVTRDPTTGLVTLVNLGFLNATEYKTSGWDLTLDYRKPTAVGTFDLHAIGTVIEYDRRQYSIDSPFLEFVGYPSEGGEAKTKANITLSWEYRQSTLAWTTTFVESYRQYDTPGSPFNILYGNFSNVPAAQGSDTIPSQTYHTVFGSYVFGNAHGLFSNLKIQLGIKNLFNTRPPFDAENNPYLYSPYGDPRLRNYWLSVRKSW